MPVAFRNAQRFISGTLSESLERDLHESREDAEKHCARIRLRFQIAFPLRNMASGQFAELRENLVVTSTIENRR